MKMPGPYICTLATNHALQDLQCFLKSLMIWNAPTVYLFADAAIVRALPSINYTGQLVVKETLNAYSGKTRQEMERIPMNGKTLWYEFQMEKLRLLDWVFAEEKAVSAAGVFYLDADICFFGSLPAVPAGYDVAVSPHMIRKRDEARYGAYNAGYVWMRSPEAVEAWRSACATSRFFEQAALEVFDEDAWSARTYRFPAQNNYGWWRMFQAEADWEIIQRSWGLRRSAEHSGIVVGDLPLLSVHTHWVTGDYTTAAFNAFVQHILEKLAPRHEPAKRLLAVINQVAK
jgi:hypothetical protein